MAELSPRLQKAAKLAVEMEKTQDKINALQERYWEMEQQKTELENTEIVARVRSLELDLSELPSFLAAVGKPGPLASQERFPSLGDAVSGFAAADTGSGITRYSREDD